MPSRLASERAVTLAPVAVAGHAPVLGFGLPLALGLLVGATLPAAPAPAPAQDPRSWETNAGFRRAPLSISPSPGPGFTLLSPDQTGVRFTNHLSNTAAAQNQIRLIGSGVALGDIDGDGWCDLYLCAQEGPNALYRNLGGWNFTNITESAGAGLSCAGQFSTGCLLADVDGDSDLDLLVNGLGTGTRLFLNDGRGHFSERAEAGLSHQFGATSLALADIDGDGDLDLYVANYRTTTIRSTGMKMLKVDGKRLVRPEDRDQLEFTPEGLVLEHGEPDILYLNDGTGRFTAVPWTGGTFLDEEGQPLKRAPRDWGLSVAFRDLNGDGRPDVYVCNDFWSADRIWLNECRRGLVQFRALPRNALRHTSTFSMGVDFADLNRDGLDEFMVLDMLSRDHPRRLRQHSSLGQAGGGPPRPEDRLQVDRNTLFFNRGDGTYAEIADFSGVSASEWSWGLSFLDVDLDGLEDILVTNGYGFDTQDADTDARLARRGPGQTGSQLLEYPPLQVPNVAFQNLGGLSFAEAGERWGFNQAGVSHGLALADLDLDGDLDVVINNQNGAASLLRNNAGAPRLHVRLRGTPPNTRGIGARVLCLGGPQPQSQEIMAGGRYLSGDEPARVFAAGTAAAPLRLEVRWRDGSLSILSNVAPNFHYELDQASARPALPPVPANPAPWFKEHPVASLPIHHADPFDGFARQPLLPRSLSGLGPGLAWFDLDGDGREELILGAGRSGKPSILHNLGEGRFEPFPPSHVTAAIAREDQSTLLGWIDSTGAASLLLGQGNHETGDASLPQVWRLPILPPAPPPEAGRAVAFIAAEQASPGPMTMADVDGDGILDLFIGGRLTGGRHAGRYPEPADSRLWLGDGGAFRPGQSWPRLGLVSGAAFGDLDGDGRPDLILACEWGPVRIFRNQAGRLEPFDPPVHGLGVTAERLSQLTGWWNGVVLADVDNDGRLDCIASNWGWNNPAFAHLKTGWRIYHGDLSGHGSVETIEAFEDEAHHRVAPWRDLDTVGAVLPWIHERFPANAAYAEASLQQILGDRFAQVRELRVNWLASTLFLNRGDHLEVRPLPPQAQFAPAFGLAAGDFDGDGRIDLFLAQNFFGVSAAEARQDAGRGLLLRGDGDGTFRPLDSRTSGVAIDGEQRGAALADYDGDGRMDLAVAQRNGPVKLFHNESASAGLRVRLEGPPGNPLGVGATLRWQTEAGEGVGPLQAVQAGSGYWSQDSATLLLPNPTHASRLAVRWPGSALRLFTVPPQARGISVNPQGTLRVLPASNSR